MSKKSNVHTDYYKTAGRDRPDDAARERMKQRPPERPPESSRTVRGKKNPPVGGKRKSRSPGG